MGKIYIHKDRKLKIYLRQKRITPKQPTLIAPTKDERMLYEEGQWKPFH